MVSKSIFDKFENGISTFKLSTMVDIVPLSLAVAAAAFVVNAYLAYAVKNDLSTGDATSAMSGANYILYGCGICALVAAVIVAFNWHM